jgi:photosystem II stability/assembly factor-like uncharacterized protein
MALPLVFAASARRIIICVLAFVLIVPTVSAQWVLPKSPTTARLRGLSVVDHSVVWCSGTKGTILRTEDAGATWLIKPPTNALELDFLDIEAFDKTIAFALSIGPGDKSRIYRTSDGGDHWSLAYQNQDPKGFLDAIAFWDRSHGLAFGDPVDGHFTILSTDDAGEHWSPIPTTGMPPALQAEGAFAASGTCLVVEGATNAWFATGGARVARVFRSTDRGRTWTAHETPVIAGKPSAGIFSLAFRDAEHGIAVGGDYQHPDQTDRTAAWTADGGITWKLSTSPAMGYRSAVAYVGKTDSPVCIAVGPSGSNLSRRDGQTWELSDKQGFHAVGAAGGEVWGVGESGLIGLIK